MFKRSHMAVVALVTLGLAGALAAPASAAPGEVCYFGECGAVASPPVSSRAPEPAATTVLKTYGSWKVVVGSNDQRMIIDTFDDGSGLAIGKVKGEFTFLLIQPRWSLTQGETFKVKMNIDGQLFAGSAHAMDATTLAIESVSANVVQAMYRGDKATIAIADQTWDINLVNGSRAIEVWAAIVD